MQNKAVKNFLDGFSVEVTPRAAAKIDNFENLVPKNTLIYIAHIEGTPIDEMVNTAKKYLIKVFLRCHIFQQEL